MYFVILELRNNRSYDALHGTLIHDLHSVRILDNVYCFEMPNADAKQARDFLRGFIDRDDGLVDVESKSWAVHKVEASPHNLDSDILKKR
ncbi:MAG: hypothetical protein P9L97_12000 [Candidatus Tenebribacter davisii]|nr:hypothetical protein [Candidatus Tenebribacter davisii]